MAQHFLLSAQARTLSLASIYRGGEDAARETFKRLGKREALASSRSP